MPDGKGGFIRKLNGDMIPFREREIADRNPIFNIILPPGKTGGYMRVNSTGTLKFRFRLFSTQALLKHRAWSLPLLWLIFGWLLLMVVINFFIFFSVREKVFLYFVFFALSLFFISSL